MNDSVSGGCLCGAVRYESTAAPEVCGHCQCEQCRKTSGTGHASHMGVAKDAVTLTGETSSYDAPAPFAQPAARVCSI